MIEDNDLDRDAIQRILDERARALAQPPGVVTTSKGIGLVVLQIGNEKYGVPIKHVQEVRPISPVTRVPNTPFFYAGLLNLRGHLCPVLDLQRYLGLPEQATTGQGKVARVSIAGLEVCLRADDILGIQWIAESDIQPLLAETPRGQRQVIAGITADLISILDLETILADPQLIVQDEGS